MCKSVSFRRHCRVPSRERGFALLELVAAMLVATLLAVWGASLLMNRLTDASAAATAQWMMSTRHAVQAYLERHHAALRNAAAPSDLAHLGFGDWRNPTLAELKAAGLLSAQFPERGPQNLEVALRTVRSGGCPGEACVVEALVHAREPLQMSGGHVDEPRIAQWLLSAQGLGGSVHRQSPQHVGGAAFRFGNPPSADVPTLPVGTIAMAVTAEQLSAAYLRVGDDRDPRFQGVTMTVAGDILAGASLAVERQFFLGDQAQERAACGREGLVARNPEGGLLVCQTGMWLPGGGRGGGGYSENTLTGCATATRNPVTGTCSCPTGYRVVRISQSGSVAAPEGLTRGYLCVG